ncbi:hypothetical protein M9458_000671, partial [Cirrhinus mrigala]
ISDPNEDTYTALELKSMTSDLYDTLTIIITDDHMTDLCSLPHRSIITDLLKTPARLVILNMRIHQ